LSWQGPTRSLARFAAMAAAFPLRIYWLVVFLFISCSAAPAELFVSPSGSDANPGTSQQPFLTLQRALGALTALCAPAPCASGATLYLRGGEYALGAPVVLANVAAGPGSRILITSFANESARVVGTLPLLFSPPPPSDPTLRSFPPDVRGRVLRGDLEGPAPAGGELLHQDRPQVPARWPEDAVALAFALGDAGVALRYLSECVNPPSEPFYCAGWGRTDYAWNWTWSSVGVAPSSPLLQWAPGFSLRGLFTYEWSDILSTVSASHANGTVEFTQETWSPGGYWGGSRFFAQGAPEALSQPGEYYIAPLSASNRTSIYWLPPASPAPPAPPLELAFSVAPGLLAVHNCTRCAVLGLSWVGSTGATLTLTNSSNVSISGNYFAASAYASVDAHTSDPNTNVEVAVERNVMVSPGWVGVWLTGGDSSTLSPSASSASHNVILNFGRNGFVFNPAIGTDGVGTKALHNLAASGPACGLMFGGALQALEYNIVADALRATLDMGVVCTGPRDWTAAGVDLRFNALLNNGYTPILSNHVSDPLRNAFYLDYGNAEHHIEGNVVLQPPHPATPHPAAVPRSLATLAWAVYNHGGRGMPVVNNLILGINGTCANAAGLTDRDQNTNNSHYFAALEACGGRGWRRPPCSSALPPSIAALEAHAAPSVEACLAAPAACGAAPFNNTLARNIMFTPEGGCGSSSDPRCPLVQGQNFVNVERGVAWAAGSEQAAAAALDFELLPNSTAFGPALGFQRIPQELWGPDWLGGAGGWRRVLFAAVPWAVGSGGVQGNEVPRGTLVDLVEALRKNAKAASV
jgi:hypothetical protein